MKVLLKQHVKNVGRVGEIVEVSDGYAVNSLFPQGKAVQATSKIINDHQTKKKAEASKKQKEREDALAKLQKLDGKEIVITEKLNPSGNLYHALGAKEIIKAVFNQLKLSISNEYFNKKLAIKESGEHQVILENYGKKAMLKVLVKGE